MLTNQLIYLYVFFLYQYLPYLILCHIIHTFQIKAQHVHSFAYLNIIHWYSLLTVFLFSFIKKYIYNILLH